MDVNVILKIILTSDFNLEACSHLTIPNSLSFSLSHSLMHTGTILSG